MFQTNFLSLVKVSKHKCNMVIVIRRRPTFIHINIVCSKCFGDLIIVHEEAMPKLLCRLNPYIPLAIYNPCANTHNMTNQCSPTI